MRITGLALLLLTCCGAAQAAPASPSICASPAQALREQGYVPINGIGQWITVTGAACGNPVILFIHGGPGNALSPFADAIFAGWQQNYTLVQWDQRGAGMTYAKQRPTDDVPLTVAQMRDDGIAVARYLQQHPGKDKVILMGSSWGSVLGVHMAKAQPDLFHAYIGTAQVVNARDNETGMYREVLALAQAAGDSATVDKLTALGAPAWTDPRNFGILRRFDRNTEEFHARKTGRTRPQSGRAGRPMDGLARAGGAAAQVARAARCIQGRLSLSICAASWRSKSISSGALRSEMSRYSMPERLQRIR